jgi:hypothetical protein
MEDTMRHKSQGVLSKKRLGDQAAEVYSFPQGMAGKNFL